MKLLAKLARRRPSEHAMALEAMLLLAFFRVCLIVVPVRKIIGAITRGSKPGGKTAETTGLSESDRLVALRVQWAVRAAARYSPVEFVCFPQSLAAYWMLRRRGLGSTLVYGVGRSGTDMLLAHTWLEIGDAVVVGDEESEGYVAVERWK